MGSPYSIFKTDSSLETKGVEIDYGDFSITIARAGGSNKRYQKAYNTKTRPFRSAIQNESLSEDASNRILRELYAETVVLGWTNVTNEKGDVIPFTKDNCIKLFEDLPDLLSDLVNMAGKTALFKAEVQEKDSKNSLSA